MRVKRQDWAKVGAELDVITTNALTHPTGSSGIGIALQNCAFSGNRVGSLHVPVELSLDAGCPLSEMSAFE